MVEEGKAVRNSQYSGSTLAQYNEQRITGEFCDVEIIADGAKFKAHKSVLSASSPYFQAMFTGGLKEQGQASVKIHLLSADTCKALVDFIYTGTIRITSRNAQDLVIAADMLLLAEVVNLCIMFMKRNLRAKNALGIYRFADGRPYGDLLKETAERFILRNFSKIIQEDEFLLLPREQLVYFLKSDYLKVDQEVQLFDGVLRWIYHDRMQRRCFIFPLLQNVQLLLVAIPHIEKAIQICPDFSLKFALRSIWEDLTTNKSSLSSLPSRLVRLRSHRLKRLT